MLYEALESDNSVDRWAAAQCLAHFGVCDSDVIGEILKQVLNTEDTVKHERGITMLGILSISSVSSPYNYLLITLTHIYYAASFIAERLETKQTIF